MLVNISSTAVMGNPGQTNYASTKCAIQGFTRTLAKELGPKNVRVNAVAPGYIRTDMMLAVGEKILEGYTSSLIPMRRLGEPEELAAVVAFLCTEDASWITGQTVVVSGRAEIT